MDDLERHFVTGIELKYSYIDILNWYRNLYHSESFDTERGIMSLAINELFKEKFNEKI